MSVNKAPQAPTKPSQNGSAKPARESSVDEVQPNTEDVPMYVTTFKKFMTATNGYRTLIFGALSAYFVGYFNFRYGFAALIGAFVVLAVKRRNEEQKNVVIKSRQMIAENEKEEILRRLTDLPSWVFFPDKEKADWLNTILAKLWPFINRYLEDFLRCSVEPQVKEQLPNMLKSFKFGAITLGKIAPKIFSIQVYDKENSSTAKDEIIIDMELCYAGDCNFQIMVHSVPTAGIQDLQLRGNLRIVLKPLFPSPPIVGAISMYFRQSPIISYNLTNAANFLEFPGFNSLLRNEIRRQIDSRMTLPRVLVIPLTSDKVDVTSLRYPMPQGVVRIGLKAARNLVDKDAFSGKSDPYAQVAVGASSFQSKVIDNSLDPKWDEFFEAAVTYVQGQTVEVQVFDSDPGSKDESLGNLSIKVATVAKAGFVDGWFPLTDTKRGDINIQAQWLKFSTDPRDLPRATQSKARFATSSPLSSCYLKVIVERASNLPANNSRDLSAAPSPRVKVSIGNSHATSQVVADNCEPTWDEGFDFLVHDPGNDYIMFDVEDKEKSYKKIGTAVLEIKSILEMAEMALQSKLTLDLAKRTSLTASLHVKCQLRVLVESEPVKISTQPQDSSDDDSSTETETHVSPKSNVSSESAAELRQRAGSFVRPSSPRSSPKPTSPRNNLGRLQLVVRFVSTRNRISVEVICARDLSDKNGEPPNAYVKVSLNNDKNSKQKTDVMKKSRSPYWSKETLEFVCTESELAGSVLEVSVKHDPEGMFNRDSELGCFQVCLDDSDLKNPAPLWYNLHSQPTPVIGFE